MELSFILASSLSLFPQSPQYKSIKIDLLMAIEADCISVGHVLVKQIENLKK